MSLKNESLRNYHRKMHGNHFISRNSNSQSNIRKVDQLMDICDLKHDSYQVKNCEIKKQFEDINGVYKSQELLTSAIQGYFD